MKITVLSVLFLVVSCLAMWRIVLNFRREAIGFRSALIWVTLWLGIGVFSIIPGLLNSAMRIAQMESRITFILVIAVFVLFALVFNLASRVDTMHRDLSKLVQEIASLSATFEEMVQNTEEKE